MQPSDSPKSPRRLDPEEKFTPEETRVLNLFKLLSVPSQNKVNWLLCAIGLFMLTGLAVGFGCHGRLARRAG